MGWAFFFLDLQQAAPRPVLSEPVLAAGQGPRVLPFDHGATGARGSPGQRAEGRQGEEPEAGQAQGQRQQEPQGRGAVAVSNPVARRHPRRAEAGRGGFGHRLFRVRRRVGEQRRPVGGCPNGAAPHLQVAPWLPALPPLRGRVFGQGQAAQIRRKTDARNIDGGAPSIRGGGKGHPHPRLPGAGLAQALPRMAECRHRRQDPPEDRAEREGAVVQQRPGPVQRGPDRLLRLEVPDRAQLQGRQAMTS